MAATASFDVSTGADLQEVDNAVNQAQKEIIQRYDFKGSKASIAFDRPKATLTLIADDDFKMKALFDVLQSKMIKRGVPVKNMELGTITPAANDTVRREIKLTQGIPQEKATAIVKAIKDKKFKSGQAEGRRREGGRGGRLYHSTLQTGAAAGDSRGRSVSRFLRAPSSGPRARPARPHRRSGRRASRRAAIPGRSAACAISEDFGR